MNHQIVSKYQKHLTGMMFSLVISSLMLATAAPEVIAEEIWKPFVGGTEDMEFGILATIDGMDVAGPSALETGYSGAYSFPRIPLSTGEGDVIGWGQTFSVTTDRELSAVQLRISRFSQNTPTGLIEVTVSEFDLSKNIPGATIASTSVSASNFDTPLGSDVPIFTVDLSASRGHLYAGRTYLLSLKSLGGFGTTSVAPYSATDIYSGGSSYYLSMTAPAIAPVSSSFKVTPNMLWPPTGKRVPVTVHPISSKITNCKIVYVSSNELITKNAYSITRDLTVKLRATRFKNGRGRVYTIDVSCLRSGYPVTGSVTVTVPHDR